MIFKKPKTINYHKKINQRANNRFDYNLSKQYQSLKQTNETMQQQPPHSHQKVQLVAQQLLKAINQPIESNITIFLTKMYKNNSPAKSKKMKSIRLNRFINLLQHVSGQKFPQSKDDIEVLYSSIAAMLNNDKNFIDQQEHQLIQQLAIQIARIIHLLAQKQFSYYSLKLLSYSVTGTQLTLPLSLQQFQSKVKASVYYQSLQMNVTEQHHETTCNVLTQDCIGQVVLKHVNVVQTYEKLFVTADNKDEVMEMFYGHMWKIRSRMNQQSKTMKQLFLASFLQNPTMTVKQVQSILKILQKPAFDRTFLNHIIPFIVQQKLPFPQLLQVNFKPFKAVEQVYLNALTSEASKKSIDDLVELFLSMTDERNYLPLYLILKSGKGIPEKYTGLIFGSEVVTVRKAVVFCLSVVDNEGAFELLLKQVTLWQQTDSIKTYKKYLTLMKSIHLSLSTTTRHKLISCILLHVTRTPLTSQSTLQFIPYTALKPTSCPPLSLSLTQTNRNLLSSLLHTLNQFSIMTKGKPLTAHQPPQTLELQHKCLLDLESVINTNPLLEHQILSTVKQLNRLLEGNTSVEDVLKVLPMAKESLLEVLLMWVNNRYDTFYMEEVNVGVLEWAVKVYRKWQAEVQAEIKIVLDKEKIAHSYKLINTLLQYSLQQQLTITPNSTDKTIFTQHITPLINSPQTRLQDCNFNDYFLTKSLYKTYISTSSSESKLTQKSISKILWLKTLLKQLKQLIKNISKGEKTASKKQVKNLLTENVADVLALKAIHQYLQSDISQGKHILIQLFHRIQPQPQFFQRAQSIASSLNVQYYPIQQQLPLLLQKFNSPTLIFLSKLITAPPTKPNLVQPKKKNKKKQQPNKMQLQVESPLLSTLTKHFSLLFGDPNQMQSYKSLFVIVRKLIDLDKITGDELATEMNLWLEQVNCVRCEGFEQWKNKVLALSKMWKNAVDIMADKKVDKSIEIHVLEKHFNLFTDLLNKLYESYSQTQQFLELEQRILLTLCLLYKKQAPSKSQMIIEQPKDMFPLLIKQFQTANSSRITLQNKFYYCHQCKKNACYSCASFLHRSHDKIFVGKTGTCQHQAKQKRKQHLLKGQSSIFGNMSAFLKKDEDIPQQLLQKISHKILLQQQLKASDQPDYINRLKDPQGIKQLLQGRIPKSRQQRSEQIKRRLREKQLMLRLQRKGQSQQQGVENQNGMSPQQEECFHYRQPYCKEFKKIHAEFKPVVPGVKWVRPRIDVSPLAKVFLRELENGGFYHEDQGEKLAVGNGTIDNTGPLVTEIKEKYLFFKNNNLKAQNRDYPYSRSRGGYGGGFNYGQDRGFSSTSSQFVRRNLFTCNKKFLFLPSSLSMMGLSVIKIKEKLDRKIQNKQVGVLQQQKNYVATPPVNLAFQVLETSLSSLSTNLMLAVVGYNQLTFYSINADGRFGRQINPEFHRVDPIVKFIWLNSSKNLFAIAYTNYIRISGISPSQNIKTFAKCQIGKTIRDFDGYMNSRMYALFIVDNTGKLFFIDVDIREGKLGSGQGETGLKTNARTVQLVDENGKVVSEEIVSVKNLDNGKVLLSMASGMLRVAEVARDNTLWKTTCIDLKKAMKSQSPLVLQSISIIKNDQQSLLLTALCRKSPIQQKKFSGSLIILNLKQPTTQSSLFHTRQQNIDTYTCTFITPNYLLFTYLNDQGAINCFRHNVNVQPAQLVEKVNVLMDVNSIRVFNKKLIEGNFFERVEDGGMVKNYQFKENKVLTNGFVCNVKEKEQMLMFKESFPCTHFVTGLTFQVQLPAMVNQYADEKDPHSSANYEYLAIIKLKFMDSSYQFKCKSRLRQIQLPLNIKQTLQLFTKDNQWSITYQTFINPQLLTKQSLSPKQQQQFIKLKSLSIFGYECRDLNSSEASVYHTAYREIMTQHAIFVQYNEEGLEEYFMNCFRLDLASVDIKRLYKMKFDKDNQGQGFKNPDINLFLKLELFGQAICYYITKENTVGKEHLQDWITLVRRFLLSKQFKRKSLENSVLRLVQAMSYGYEQKALIAPGHPLHRSTIINLHEIIRSYEKWHQKKNLSTFEHLCTTLSSTIFTQCIDLFSVLQLIPELMIQLSVHFKSLLLTANKASSIQQTRNRLPIICSKFVSILCQFYQLLKNKQIPSSQQTLLSLLQQVFGQVKAQLPKQLIMNPFFYLQSILELNSQTVLQTNVDLLQIAAQQQLQTLSMYENFDKPQKKSSKQLLVDSVIKQQPPQTIVTTNLNASWQPLEQQANMPQEEEEREMYMQIEQYSDEDQHAQIQLQEEIIEPQLQIQSKKGPSSIIPSAVNENRLQEKLISKLLSKQLQQTKKLAITHHDFPLQLAIALFRRQNYLNEKNVYFYLGLLYNLLKIVQDNMKILNNKKKLYELVKVIDSRIETSEHSPLFIAVNFFVCPQYAQLANSQYQLLKPLSTLSQHFILYYSQNLPRFYHLLTSYTPTPTSPIMKLSQIMKFTPFPLKNELYNLRLITNLYLVYRLNAYDFVTAEQKQNIKKQLLHRLVKFPQVKVLKNVMLYEKWENQLDKAKILVGFEIVGKENVKLEDMFKGINMLHECAKKTPQKFIDELLEDQTKVTFLEEFSLIHNEQLTEDIQTKIFELLGTYYGS